MAKSSEDLVGFCQHHHLVDSTMNLLVGLVDGQTPSPSATRMLASTIISLDFRHTLASLAQWAGGPRAFVAVRDRRGPRFSCCMWSFMFRAQG
jgi:hypothetical protein